MPDFVHLHNHTMYSLLDGLCQPKDLIKKAKEMGMEALAITDHGNMFGAVEFYEACQAEGLKPILGMEGYLAPGRVEDRKPGGAKANKPYHQLLIARNMQGYKNLMRLNTRAQLEGFYYKPRIDSLWLEELGEGIIATSSCMAGEIPQMIMQEAKDEEILQRIAFYQRCFGQDNYYLELQHHDIQELLQVVNKRLVYLGQKYGIPLVATNDVHYVRKEDHQAQDAIICVSTNKKIADDKRMKMTSKDYYLRSGQEMAELFPQQPEALANTVKIAQQCDVKLEFGKWLLPDFECPEPYSPESYLKHLCAVGFEKRYGIKVSDELELLEASQEVSEEKLEELLKRALYELSVINPMGYASYYLMVQDLVNYARAQGIGVGPGRGSGAGSLVAFLLYITNLDPLDHGLLFERFLNPERAAMPDFDLDFADDRREEIIRYSVEKYGQEHVAHIVTFGTMKAKAAVRDIGRVLGMAYSDVDTIAKLIPEGLDLETALVEVEQLQRLYKEDPLIKELLDLARRVEGNTRHTSVHAAAVVISKDPLVEDIPLQKDHKTGKVTTQYSMKPAEKIGLLKVDFLGLKTLTIIQNAVNYLQKSQGIELDMSKISLNDSKVFELFVRGETLGVFQMESGGMAKLAQKLKPNVFSDIIALIALYRPGPMEWIDDFVAVKHGLKTPTYPHKSMAPILEPTYGIAVYQEQIQQIAQQFAGFSLGDGYILIKAIGKKMASLIQELRGKFIEGAMKTQGVSQDKAQEVFGFIEPFARYGFNKSHAACYSMITYYTAFLKANYPVEFMAAVLTSEMSNQDNLTKYIAECRRMKIPVGLPDINRSDGDFTVDGQSILFGLNAIRNVGAAAVEEIIRERTENGTFDSLVDFCSRVSLRVCNVKVLESLVMSGAFDHFGTRTAQLQSLEQVIALGARQQKNRQSGQTTLFDFTNQDNDQDSGVGFVLPEVAEVEMEKLLSWEKELLGYYISDHPLAPYAPLWQLEGFYPLSTVKDQSQEMTKPLSAAEKLYGVKKPELEVQLVVQVAWSKVITTKKGDEMAFVGLEDMSGSLEGVVFPRVYAKNNEFWQESTVLLLEGRVQVEPEEDPKIIVNKAKIITSNQVDKLVKSWEKKINKNGKNASSPPLGGSVVNTTTKKERQVEKQPLASEINKKQHFLKKRQEKRGNHDYKPQPHEPFGGADQYETQADRPSQNDADWLWIELPVGGESRKNLKKLQDMLPQFPGQTQVGLKLVEPEQKTQQRVKLPLAVDANSQDLKRFLAGIVG